MQHTNLYSGKAADVIRVLLVRYPQRMPLRALAKEAGVSLGQAFNVSKSLINEGLALRDSNNYEFTLMAPSVLLKRWATVNNFVANTRFIDYNALEDSNFFGKLKELDINDNNDYALTGPFGALFIAPWVRTNSVQIYVRTEEDAKNLASELDLIPIEGVGNVRFAIPNSNGVFYGARKIDSVQIVSDVQLYVDLLNYPARGAEAASRIYDVIEQNWGSEEFNV